MCLCSYRRHKDTEEEEESQSEEAQDVHCLQLQNEGVLLELQLRE